MIVRCTLVLFVQECSYIPCMLSGLRIYFEQLSYAFNETDVMVTVIIQHQRTQSAFHLRFRTISIDNAESMFDITDFIDSATIPESARATPGR